MASEGDLSPMIPIKRCGSRISRNELRRGRRKRGPYDKPQKLLLHEGEKTWHRGLMKSVKS